MLLKLQISLSEHFILRQIEEELELLLLMISRMLYLGKEFHLAKTCHTLLLKCTALEQHNSLAQMSHEHPQTNCRRLLHPIYSVLLILNSEKEIANKLLERLLFPQKRMFISKAEDQN